jgi:dolichyl-phosphate beta-glucosyltransferase
MINELSIIFPIYNEEKRLSQSFKKMIQFKKNVNKKIEFIFVNDGSNDNSLKLLSKFKKNNRNLKIRVLNQKKNNGKGHALKMGVEDAEYDWILTTDIDLSVSLSQIFSWDKLIKKNIYVYFGSRSHPESKIFTPFYRYAIGLIFQLINKIFFNFKIRDTQCGFKLYKNKVGKKIFSDISQFGYAHDIEILLICIKKKIKFIELPVEWSHKKDGKVNIISDSINMFLVIIKLKFKFFLY